MASSPKPDAVAGPVRTSPAYDERGFLKQLRNAIATLRFTANDKNRLNRSCEELVRVLNRCPGKTLQDRWLHFEKNIWPRWLASENRPSADDRWTWGARVIVMARLVVPSWEWGSCIRFTDWVVRLPENDPLFQQYEMLRNATGQLSWAGNGSRLKPEFWTC